jgi:hypothetical protein
MVSIRAGVTVPEPVVPLSPKTLNLLRSHLARVVGPIEFIETLAEMTAESRSEEWRRPADEGFWIFGRAGTGDAWAIDVKNGEQVVVLSHDLIWEQEAETVRDAACEVADSLADAISLAAHNALPEDYFAAIEGEALEEPDAKYSWAPGGLDAGLVVAAKDRPGVLASIFGTELPAWEKLEEVFFELEAMERATLGARYGLFGGPPQTVEATAKSLDLSPDQVREEEARGLRWLKRLVKRK